MLTPINKILFATTLDAETREVTKMAASLAVKYQAKVILVHSLEPISQYGQALVESCISKEQLQKIRQEGKTELMQTIHDKIHAFYHDEMITDESQQGLLEKIVIKEEFPDKLILETAETYNVDLVVMGTQHRRGLSKVFLGSTARKVMEHSDKPVLVVPL